MGRSSRPESGHMQVLQSTTCNMSNGIGACSGITHYFSRRFPQILSQILLEPRVSHLAPWKVALIQVRSRTCSDLLLLLSPERIDHVCCLIRALGLGDGSICPLGSLK